MAIQAEQKCSDSQMKFVSIYYVLRTVDLPSSSYGYEDINNDNNYNSTWIWNYIMSIYLYFFVSRRMPLQPNTMHTMLLLGHILRDGFCVSNVFFQTQLPMLFLCTWPHSHVWHTFFTFVFNIKEQAVTLERSPCEGLARRRCSSFNVRIHFTWTYTNVCICIYICFFVATCLFAFFAWTLLFVRSKEEVGKIC